MTAHTSPHDKEMVPRALVMAMFGMVLVVLMFVTFARLSDRPLEAQPVNGPVAQERLILIQGTMGGSALVHDIDGTLIADLDQTKGGFIAGVWRSLNHERAKINADPNGPVRLVQFQDGRLALFDPSTGLRIELMGFGADNTAAFLRLLNA